MFAIIIRIVPYSAEIESATCSPAALQRATIAEAIWVDPAELYRQADASVVCGSLHVHKVTRKEKTLGEAITNPQVIVEVLSPSTEADDRGEKFAAYRQITSLEAYVLVSQDERSRGGKARPARLEHGCRRGRPNDSHPRARHCRGLDLRLRVLVGRAEPHVTTRVCPSR